MPRNWIIGLVLVLTLICAGVHANSHRELWYFTAEEIETAYRFQMNFGERISRPLEARGCFLGQPSVRSFYRERELWISCHFIKETVRHITKMLDAGAARYLFPLDADHAHLGVPRSLWEENYSKRPFDEIMPAILADRATVALYHTAEHLTATDPKTGHVDRKAKAWKDKRNVLGFYDGRPIEILPPHPAGVGVGMPESYQSFAGFRFLANAHGQLYLFRKKEAITFDISLDLGESSEDPFVTGMAVKK